MHTDKNYAAVSNTEEKGAAIAIIVEVEKQLKEKDRFEVKKPCPQFGLKAETLVRNSLGRVASIEFKFDATEGEVIATVTRLDLQ